MKILHLTLKKQWFDMIVSGEKLEEYREIKPYWIKRLTAHNNAYDDCRDFSAVRFTNGYGWNAPSVTVECLGIEIGLGMLSWGAEKDVEYFVIKLGKQLSKKYHEF